MADRAGIKIIKISGTAYDCKGLAAVRVSRWMREPVLGADGYHGTSLKGTVPGADITITDHKDIDIDRLQNIVDDDVYIVLANGKTYHLANATVLDQVELNPETGEIPLKFACSACLEV